ncbi:MAG: OmpA family protein [Woeseia sp.]
MTSAATGDQPDPDASTDVLSAEFTVNNNADLFTTKTVDNATPLAGDNIVYTLSVTNNGPAAASNVSLTESLPAGVTYVSDDGAGAFDAGTGVWTVGNLANTATATLNITAVVDSGAGLLPQPITNTITAASGDQPDPDPTTDVLSQDIFVTLIDQDLIRLSKSVGRNRASVGEIIVYNVELRNTSSSPVGPVQLADTPARGFKYVQGTAELNGMSIPDPLIGMPLRFDIGTLPGLVDTNGNGTADPGEPGYAVLSYRMVAGAGVAPGVWTNTAAATISCDTCAVSNTASASIEIIEDTLFDLGTIIGKVFYDTDLDGYQDAGETGIAAAMVVLDDGTYVLTDEFGRYHFPGVKPGQRLLKINHASIAGRSTSTNDRTQILNVTPGLLAKGNFGVIVETIDATIGNAGELGVAVNGETQLPPLLINGNSQMPSLLINGAPVHLANADVQLGAQRLESIVEISKGELTSPIRFRTAIDTDAILESWQLRVLDAQDETAYEWSGSGTPPATIEWDGQRSNGKLVSGGAVYAYFLTANTRDGQVVSSGRRLFGVNRRNSVSLNLAGGAFVTGSHELTSKARALLKETAKAIRAYPDEIVSISGHTDSVGSEASNMALSERRARSAFNYLHEVEDLPASQFVVHAYGESRPLADNDTSWGRELNRRVEISGDITSVERAKNYDPYRQGASVRIDDADIKVDEYGNFRTKVPLPADQDTLQVAVKSADGRAVTTAVPIPTLTIVAPQGRALIPVASKEPLPYDTVLHTTLVATTEPGNTVTFNGEAVEVDEDGRFTRPVSVSGGDNYFGLVARNPQGMLRIANLKLSVEQSDLDEPTFIAEPIPQLALQLPPRGVPMTNANLLVPGSTLPGNRVFINEQEIPVDAEGRFVAGVELQLGENPFAARVVDADGHAGVIEETFVYNGNPLFFMALVDGKFSQLKTSGSLQAAGKEDSSETVSEGRIAYYLKGHVLGKYLVTSAFDSGQQELGNLFSDLTKQDNDRLLTNIDPDTLYPVYGDSSTLVYDAQSQSKFYLALESETVNALIGNYALNFTDTELAGYQRTLYGASVTYLSAAKDEAGNSKTKAQAFHATIEQAHVRDELRATGGSLYYLSQRDIIEGSEHVSVIVRDQDSGLILRRTALQQGIDYSIDYVDGRLLTNRPISSFSADNSLIESNVLGGSAVHLQVDYESAVDGFEQTASGARVRQGVGERLAVGVTTVNEQQLDSEYSLQAADAEYRLGDNSRIKAEFATSEGNNSVVNVSEDGGLSYQSVAQAANSSGDAFKIAAEIDAGEWFGVEDRVLVNTYFKRLDTGFSANSTSSEQGSEKSGIAASWKINDESSLLGRFEKQTQLGTGSDTSFGTLQWNMMRKRWGAAAELENRAGLAGDAAMAALRMNYRWNDAINSILEHQQTLSGIENNQSTVGVAVRATEKITLDAKATMGTLGESAQLGAQMDWRGNRLYLAHQVSDLVASGSSNNKLVGIEAPFGPDGAIYSEYRWSELALGPQRQAMIGARQRFQATEGLRIEVSGEHSAENTSTNNAGDRYAFSIGAMYANDHGLKLSTRNEYRKDSRSLASEQMLSTTNMEWAFGNDLAMLGKYRFSKSESSTQVGRNIDFTEASIGLAYRPVEHDRLNLLTRYTRLTNTPTEFQTSSTISGLKSDIFSVDWSFQVSQRIEWVGKQAMRWSETDGAVSEPTSLTSLSVQRINWGLTKAFLLGTEYRLMTQDVANDQRDGFVTELMWGVFDPLRLGIGYNFSDVSDNEYADYDFKTTGFFLRVQGKF